MQLLTVTASKRTDPKKLYKINYSLRKAKYIISDIYMVSHAFKNHILKKWKVFVSNKEKFVFCIEMHVYVPKYNFVSEHIIEDSYRMQKDLINFNIEFANNSKKKINLLNLRISVF